jgi:hypothetical protein
MAVPDWDGRYASMEISRRRQDTDIARMADFLRGIVGMFTPIIIERLDQRNASWNSRFVMQCIISESQQIMRAVR